MVLVSYIPYNYISILQTKLSNREGYEARRGGVEAMPLDQHVEGRHGKGQTRLKIRPHAVHDFLEVADERQHREDRLHEHTVLPRATLTQFEVGRITLRGMEAGVTQDNHLLFELPNEPLKGIVRHIGCVTCPPHDQPPLIEQQTEFASDDPAVVRHAFAADLLRAPTLSDGMDQFDAVGVDDAEHGRSSQEDLRPGLMRPEEA